MSALIQEILTKVSALPEFEQQEVLDFIEFLQAKLDRKLLANERDNHLLETQNISLIENEVSPIYQAFEQAGLIGCIETDEQLSTTYKK